MGRATGGGRGAMAPPLWGRGGARGGQRWGGGEGGPSNFCSICTPPPGREVCRETEIPPTGDNSWVFPKKGREFFPKKGREFFPKRSWVSVKVNHSRTPQSQHNPWLTWPPRWQFLGTPKKFVFGRWKCWPPAVAWFGPPKWGSQSKKWGGQKFFLGCYF